MTLPEVIGAGAPSELITFGEIAELCANRSNRTILENEAWNSREWITLGKLLEALFNDRLGKVQIESEEMTEIDAEERSGSLSNFLNERLQKNLGIKFELIGGIVRKPLGWGKFVSNTGAQALADALSDHVVFPEQQPILGCALKTFMQIRSQKSIHQLSHLEKLVDRGPKHNWSYPKNFWLICGRTLKKLEPGSVCKTVKKYGNGTSRNSFRTKSG